MKHYLLGLLIFAFTSPLVFAHEGHNHEASVEAAPQGGQLRDAPPFKTEIIIKNDLVKLYVYDDKLKAIKLDKETLTGDVQFPRAKQPTKLTFKKVKEEKPINIKNVGEITERYETKIPNITKAHRFDMHVNLEVGDKKAKADFGIDNIH